MSEEEINKIMKFSKQEDVNLLISKTSASIWGEKERKAFDFAQYSAIQITRKNVESNTKG